jgi:hypothetical protein
VAGHGGTAMPCHATACGGIRHGDLHPCPPAVSVLTKYKTCKVKNFN